MPNVDWLKVLRKFNQTMHERVNAENELTNPTSITTLFDFREKRHALRAKGCSHQEISLLMLCCTWHRLSPLKNGRNPFGAKNPILLSPPSQTVTTVPANPAAFARTWSCLVRAFCSVLLNLPKVLASGMIIKFTPCSFM
jgi:hypothetical protein